jgi:hypothetical protein
MRQRTVNRESGNTSTSTPAAARITSRSLLQCANQAIPWIPASSTSTKVEAAAIEPAASGRQNSSSQ